LGRPLPAAFGIGQHAHLCDPHVAGWHGPPADAPDEEEAEPLPPGCELDAPDVPVAVDAFDAPVDAPLEPAWLPLVPGEVVDSVDVAAAAGPPLDPEAPHPTKAAAATGQSPA
jgi:hypothetical protein